MENEGKIEVVINLVRAVISVSDYIVRMTMWALLAGRVYETRSERIEQKLGERKERYSAVECMKDEVKE